ncbi:hypothetical protein [Meridianimarinicoccus sp. MJW13]|uniref:hypothetical protein n=1 Tax=Meridianimarinicoccus sp. MJW13 TaxID=2720031 RepID=UPI00186882FE|nr:hypothetical protein [Fluviibacterium sp. MJW13]
MLSLIRLVVGLCLIVLVALTSLQLGLSRGTARVAGTVVLCTGTGPVAVTVDRDGQPVSRPHVCPDCVMSAMAGLAAPLVLTARQVQPRQLVFTQAQTRAEAAPLIAHRARGPPRIL